MLKRLINYFDHSESLIIKESETGVWMVKRKFNIVYMGSKEKCLMYLSKLQAA